MKSATSKQHRKGHAMSRMLTNRKRMAEKIIQTSSNGPAGFSRTGFIVIEATGN
jgi:hypothetical protein